MEMLVVIIIIAIVSTIGTNTYKSQRKQVIYNDSVFKILSMIKQARNYAVTSRPVYDPFLEESLVPAEGYGVYISRSDVPGETRVVLFANTAASDEISASQFDENQTTDDIIEEEYLLHKDTALAGLSIDLAEPVHTVIGGGTDSEAVIIYRPPLADATLAVNDYGTFTGLEILNDLYLEFRRYEVPEEIPSMYIHINRLAGFPEIVK